MIRGRTLGQLVRFGVVGTGATFTHGLTFVGTIELGHLAPLIANLVAFSIAVLVSFVGHLSWTFRRQRQQGLARSTEGAFVRFVLVALAGLLLNTLVVFAVVNVLGGSYLIALGLMVTLVPLAVFGLSKRWAFA